MLLLLLIIVIVMLGCSGGYYGSRNGWFTGGQNRSGNTGPTYPNNVPFSNGSNTQPATSGYVVNEGQQPPVMNTVGGTSGFNPLYLIIIAAIVIVLVLFLLGVFGNTFAGLSTGRL